MTRTNKAVTAHGEVDYETVTCDSCGSEVMKRDARRFVIGDLKATDYWSHKNTKEFHFDSGDYATGWACSYCADGDIAAVPQVGTLWNWWRSRAFVTQYIIVLAGALLAFVILASVAGAVA